MRFEEARSILQSIIDRNLPLTGEVRKLAGDDECVVVLSTGMFLWSKADWKLYCKGALPALNVPDPLQMEEASP